MTNKLLEQHGAIVTLDFLPVGQGHNTLHLLHKLQGQSADYALQYGGYAIFEQEADIRGYMSYLQIRSRAGYGINGWLVRTIDSFQQISLDEGGRFTNDAYFTDEIAEPQLSSIRAALNYTEGHLAAINGRLDSWVMLAAARFGLNPDNI